MSFDAALISILLPALVAGLLVVATHVPMGQEVLKRGIIFIDLAVAQIAAVGVVLAIVMDWESVWSIQASAISMALIGAYLLSLTEQRWPKEQEAIIGVSFILASSAGILLLANNPHGGEHIKALLAGQILWVGWNQIWLTLIVYMAILVIWFGFRSRLGQRGFYLLFAVNVTLSVQLVGVYLVFATLILPALATINTIPRKRLINGYLIGGISYGLGLILSAYFDLPTGALVTWVLALSTVLYRLFYKPANIR